MRYFVSYARRDNSVEQLHQINAIFCDAGHVYIDDLERHAPDGDRRQVVVDALNEADVFIAVQSNNYLNTEWTRWEYETARHLNIEIMALLPNRTFARIGEPQWPWPDYLPPEMAKKALTQEAGPPSAAVHCGAS